MKPGVRKIAVLAVQELKKELLYLFSDGRPRKILFDHLPKCGGLSLRAYFEAHYLKRKTFLISGDNPAASVDKFKGLPQSKRHGYDLVMGHLANQLFDYVHPECLKVTVFREPVDRMVSHFYYARRTPKHYLYSKIHESEMSLEDYVTSNLSGELRNWYTTHFSGLTVSEAERSPEASIAGAVEAVLNKYDVVGFLDSFSAFVERLRYQAGLRYEYQNKKVNVTQGRISMDDVPPSVIRKIEQVNQLDVAFYEKIRGSIG